MRTTTALVASIALAIGAAPAIAQNSGLVVVDLSNADVANDLARNLKVNVSDITALANVAIPIGLAANVCDVNANVLAAQKKTDSPTCTAKNNSAALQKAVQDKMSSVNQ